MRTNIVIDDALMAAAMEAGGFRSKKDAVEEGLRLLARRAAYQNLRALRGKLQWNDGSGDRLPAPATHTVQEEGPGYSVGVARRKATGKAGKR